MNELNNQKMARIIIMYFGALKSCQKTCLTMKGDRGTLGPCSASMNRNDQPQKEIPIFLGGTGKDDNIVTCSSERDARTRRVSGRITCILITEAYFLKHSLYFNKWKSSVLLVGGAIHTPVGSSLFL